MRETTVNWSGQLEACAVYFSLPLIIYLVGGPLFKSLHPTGMLNWQGRRWRKGITVALLLLAAWLETSELRYHAHVIPGFLAVAAYAILSVLFLLLIRWWWQDTRKEKAAKEALIEKLQSEGHELTEPPRSLGKNIWRWTVNGYALFLLVAGLYVLVRYLVRH
jgi:hypothetical protein